MAIAVTTALATTICATPAGAKIKPVAKRAQGTPLAKAVAVNRAQVSRSIFSVIPPSSHPAALSTTRLAGFPRHGKSYAILSNGDSRFAARRNSSSSSSGAGLGPLIRGARDVLIMRVYLRVPRNANCLSFSFRFLSEEFPEFVNDIYNDAFIAELDDSDWDASGPADPTITADRNFAVDSAGRPIRVNAVGDTSLSSANARGTTYDGATRILRASTPITPGRHSLYLSIFDQGDRAYDSAVFIDRLRVKRDGNCQTGVVVDD
jgi:hypothetical protein